jgi:thiol-disulfide isomerase/thioredoxin
MLKKSILPLALAIALLSQGCSNDNKEQVKEAKNISQNEYALTGLNKQSFTVIKETDGFRLKQAQGKVVLYDIYATWCPPCRSAASHLTSLQEKYKDDLIIIGISIEDDITDEKLLSFREQNNANYILSNSKQNRTLADDIVESIGLGTRYPIPLMVLYKDGKIINHFVGMVEEEFIESDIKKALEN